MVKALDKIVGVKKGVRSVASAALVHTDIHFQGDIANRKFVNSLLHFGMANKTPEQDLINDFVRYLRAHEDQSIRIAELFNDNCKSKRLADVEFESADQVRWVIEAKSNDSKDKHNTVHKIFGELLKETGRTNRSNCRHAVLIPQSSITFYSRAFQSIAREKFLGFGALIPIDTVFTCGPDGVERLTWEGLYDAYSPPKPGPRDSRAAQQIHTGADLLPAGYDPAFGGN